jgi:UDP:flavonoid glycosyltransferase YjiC (YdhE family)
VSHAEVLKRACLLVSHAGHGVVLKALYYGVPMVLVPLGRDQPGVAARAWALGVAEVIPRDALSDARLAKAVEAGPRALSASAPREHLEWRRVAGQR